MHEICKLKPVSKRSDIIIIRVRVRPCPPENKDRNMRPSVIYLRSPLLESVCFIAVVGGPCGWCCIFK